MGTLSLNSTTVSIPLFALPIALIFGMFLFSPTSPGHPKIHGGIPSLPPSKLKSRLIQLYPPDLHGPGESVKLHYGRTRYWLIGPEDGKKVVLICGLSIPSIVWSNVAPILAKNGFRVLLYDLYGRGYSDAPSVPYDRTLYITQLALLLQAIGWEKTSVVGLSMGGGIASAFVSTFPHLFDGNVVFIASVGAMKTADFPLAFSFLTSPFGVPFAHLAVRRMLKQTKPLDPTDSDVLPEMVKRAAEVVTIQSLTLPGYAPAIASSIKVGPLQNEESSFQAIGSQLTRVLLIWGTKDSVVNPKFSRVLKGYMPQSELLIIKDAEHDVTLTHSDQVGAAIVKHLKSGS